tara:strand:+ start:2476 stop:2946 length:471 start_codon:yes stop_codon:yes gene_type:complete
MAKGFKDSNGKFRPTGKKNGITVDQLGKLDREATQEELKNLVVEMTPEQMENLKLLKKENVKAKASGDNRMPWERHQEQVNYNEKTGELWNKLDDKTKTKMLKELGIKDEHNAENLKKSFMELGKQDGYGKSDFREYLSPEINSHYGLPTKWYDKS